MNELLNNLSLKLKRYLSDNNLSILQLSKISDIKYQTLKRLVITDNVESLPNIASIHALATYFKCSISELLDDKVKISIKMFTSIDAYLQQSSLCSVNVFLPIEQVTKITNNNTIFAIQSNTSEQKDLVIYDIEYKNCVQVVQIFVEMDHLEYDGYYLARINNSCSVIKVISVSSSFLIIEENNKEIKINRETIHIIAKYYGLGIVTNDNYGMLKLTRASD